MLNSISPRHYLPKALPLSGPDYQVSAQKGHSSESFTVAKVGDRISVRHGNPGRNLDLALGPDTVSYRRNNQLPTTVARRGNQVIIDRPNGQDVIISKAGQTITVDRPGVGQDVAFTRTPEGLLIDRYGVHNDVAISRRQGQIFFDHGTNQRDTAVALSEGLEFDPVAWQGETTLAPHAWALLSDWFEADQIQPEKLLTLTQHGTLLEHDHLLS